MCNIMRNAFVDVAYVVWNECIELAPKMQLGVC